MIRSSDQRRASMRPSGRGWPTPTKPMPCRVCGKPAVSAPHDRSDLGQGLKGIGRIPWPSAEGHPSKRYCESCYRERAWRFHYAGHRWERQARLDGLLRCAGVPDKYIEARFSACDSDTPHEALKAVREWARRPAGVLFLWGDVGRGKSFLAACAFREWKRHHDDGLWVSEELLMKELRAGFAQGQAAVDRAGGGPVLVYDDLLAHAVGDWELRPVRRILDRRHAEMRPTIVTCNVNLETVAERLDDRTASRIAEAGRVVRIAGEDRRLTRHGK